MNFYFSHGRTAFKYGLKYLKLKKNDKILLPEYICDVLLDPLDQLKIKPIFYKINPDFSCNLNSIKMKFNKSVKALLMINYFGFEENKKKYYNFCKKNGIYLIEDSCHSLNTNFKKSQKLSDFIFYSPKKIIKEIYSGGILKLNNIKKDQDILEKKLNLYRVSYFNIINTYLEKYLISLKRYLKYLFFTMPTYNKFNSIKNLKISKDYAIDKSSLERLNKTKLKTIMKLRIENYNKWKKICLKNDMMIPINRKINNNIIPWMFPVNVKDAKTKKKILSFGWKNGYSITSWPTLPKRTINSSTKRKWRNLICFYTDKAPKVIKHVNF